MLYDPFFPPENSFFRIGKDIRFFFFACPRIVAQSGGIPSPPRISFLSIMTFALKCLKGTTAQKFMKDIAFDIEKFFASVKFSHDIQTQAAYQAVCVA